MENILKISTIKNMDRMIVFLIELFTKIYWRKMHMEYKRNIYLFLIFDFLTNLSPLSFIYALFLKQQNMSLTQVVLFLINMVEKHVLILDRFH